MALAEAWKACHAQGQGRPCYQLQDEFLLKRVSLKEHESINNNVW